MSQLTWITPVEAVMALARKAYSGSWLVIAVREGVGQNSADAGAMRCDVQIDRLAGAADDGSDVTRIRQIDNGRGMTPEVLQSAFFTFGGSYKPDSGAAGGYGFAKFAILDGDALVDGNSWALWTRPRGSDLGYHVTSSSMSRVGAHEDGQPIHSFPSMVLPDFFPRGTRSGTVIEVYRKEPVNIAEAIEVLENTHRPGCQYFVNGEEIEPLCRAKEVAKLSYGRLLFKKSCRAHQTSHLIVRTQGSFQFRKWVSSRLNGVAILEIDPSLEVRSPAYPLTPAREQVRTEFRHELDAAVEKLLELEKPEEEDPFVLTLYQGYDVPLPKPAPEPPAPPLPPAAIPVVDRRDATVDDMMLELRQLVSPTRVPAAPVVTAAAVSPVVAAPPVPPARRSSSPLVLRGDLVFTDWLRLRRLVEEAGRGKSTVRTTIESLPDLLVRRHRTVRTKLDPFRSRNLRLQVAWHAVLCTIVDLAGLEKKAFGIGWVLKSDVLAEHLKHGGREFFLLSPRGLQLRDITALTATLVQRATHELLHRERVWHDDVFVAQLHQRLEKLNPHQRALRLSVKTALRAS